MLNQLSLSTAILFLASQAFAAELDANRFIKVDESDAGGHFFSQVIYGTVWQCGTQRRSNESYRFVVELIRSGKIGRLHTITAVLGGWGGNGVATPEPEPNPDVFDYDRWLGQAPWAPYSSLRVRLGRKVVWDASNEEFVDDDQANRMLRRVPRPPWEV